MGGYEWKMCLSITQLFLENMNGGKGIEKKFAIILLY
jgi:hypothetical protein